jgi:hypothetical protein
MGNEYMSHETLLLTVGWSETNLWHHPQRTLHTLKWLLVGISVPVVGKGQLDLILNMILVVIFFQWLEFAME